MSAWAKSEFRAWVGDCVSHAWIEFMIFVCVACLVSESRSLDVFFGGLCLHRGCPCVRACV